MPIVEVKLAGSISREQRALIAAEMTATLEKHAGKDPRWTYVTFTEIHEDHWAVAGSLLDTPET